MKLTERNQRFGYHSTTYNGILNILNSGNIRLSDASKLKEPNNGYSYFLSTHNTSWNSVYDKPGYYITLKINFENMKYGLVHKDSDNEYSPYINKMFIKKVNSYQYKNPETGKYPYEYEDRVFSNIELVKISDGAIEECHILFNRETPDFDNVGDIAYIISEILKGLQKYNIKWFIYDKKQNFMVLRNPVKNPIYYIYETLFDKIKYQKLDLTSNNAQVKSTLCNLLHAIDILNKTFNRNYTLIDLCKTFEVNNVIDLIKQYKETKQKEKEKELNKNKEKQSKTNNIEYPAGFEPKNNQNIDNTDIDNIDDNDLNHF